jgi:hypothetical protein
MSGLEVISEMPLSGFAVLTQAKRPRSRSMTATWDLRLAAKHAQG